MGRGPGWRRHLPPAVFIAGLAVMVFALARPSMVVTLPSQQGTVILTMDVSGSMRADDLQPSRLDAAKSAALAFVQKQPAGVRIGVVSFSDNAFLVQEPTADKEAINAAISRLTPRRGTAIGSALLTSVDAIEEVANFEGGEPFTSTLTAPTPTPMPEGVYQPAIVVLLTDGESNRGPHPLDVVEQVATRGIRVYTIGVGSLEGTVLRAFGRSMRVGLDEETLKAVAAATGGIYYSASTAQDLQKIYENLSTRLVFTREQSEVTAYFTGIAILLLVVAGAFSLLWFNRLP